MDIQAMMNAISAQSSLERGKYHLNLGGLRKALEEVPSDTFVEFDDRTGVGELRSYRGYYDDLALGSAKRSMAGDLLEKVRAAIGATFEGYKGGEYKMTSGTPLWKSEYGVASSVAIIGTALVDGVLILLTKQIDD